MRIAFGAHELSARRLRGDADVEAFLRGCDLGHISLGDDSEGRQAFSAIALHSKEGVGTFGIVVRSEASGISPVLLLREDVGQIWIGYNRAVAAVSVRERKLRFKSEMESLFHRFLRSDQSTIVLLETAVSRVGDHGELIWHHSTDLIADWSLSDTHLRLVFWDDEPVSISIASGALTREGD